uniref:Uncharacterized protein n=1 Tax=Panagrolaimus davidi TaxID=227884 RepID=A0A914QRN5_9BILA
MEVWAELKVIVNYLWRILVDEEGKHKSEDETMPTLEESWNKILSSHDWSKIPNGLPLSNLLTNISQCFFDPEKKEKFFKKNSKKFYCQLLELLTEMNNGSGNFTWITKKIGSLFMKEKENIANNDNEILILSALGYQILPYLWIMNRDTESSQHQKILNELYFQISYFLRSFSAMFYLIKNKTFSENKLEWIIIAKDCLSEFLAYIEVGISRTNAIEIEKGFEKVTKQIKTSFPTNINERKEAIEMTLSELFELRTLAISNEDNGVAADLAEAISVIYNLSEEFENAILWNETAKIDRKKVKQGIST